jgi:hypothetical protein
MIGRCVNPRKTGPTGTFVTQKSPESAIGQN